MVDEVTTIAGETGDAPPPEVTAATPVPVEGDEKAEATPSGGERGSSAKTPTEEDAAGEGEGGKEASGNDNGAGRVRLARLMAVRDTGHPLGWPLMRKSLPSRIRRKERREN